MKRDTLGLYVHFPFCSRKCLYCDFPSYDGKEHLMGDYLGAMKLEIDLLKSTKMKDRKIDTVFLGGGTPTLFNGEELKILLNYIKESLPISREAEITIEANPETLTIDKLRALKKAQINRLSIGMQSGQDSHLRSLGRAHTVEDVIQSINWARELGFDNINLDLMFGLPNQTMDDWMKSLEIAVKMDVEHISAYALIVEENTHFFRLMERGDLAIPLEEIEREMYHMAVEFLKASGYIQYEISNFAKPGRECRHNLIYWHNEEYIGIGSGAHSSMGGERWSNYKDVSRYIEAVHRDGSGIEHREKIPVSEQRFETIMMGLRLIQGVSKSAFYERYGHDIGYYYRDIMDSLKREGMLEETLQYIYLTPKGLDFQNQVLIRFME